MLSAVLWSQSTVLSVPKNYVMEGNDGDTIIVRDRTQTQNNFAARLWLKNRYILRSSKDSIPLLQSR